MPIIVNEFAIIPAAESEAAEQRPRDTPEAPLPPAPPDPFDILRVEQVNLERRRRLWAD